MTKEVDEREVDKLMEEVFPPRRSYEEVLNDLGDEISKEVDEKGEPLSPYLLKKSDEQKQDTTAREQFYIWLATPQFLRNPQQKKALAKKLNISTKTLDNWETELDEYDSKLFFLANKVFIDRSILHGAQKGNFNMAKLAKELSGELVEKKEFTHRILTADDIDRLRREADTELRAELQGIREVQTQSNLLSQ